ncbi:MAG: phage terminase large subunit [Alphaproteobacteria bacterium]
MTNPSFLHFISVWNERAGFSTPDHHLQIAIWLERLYKGLDQKGLLMAFRNSGKSTLVGLFCGWCLLQNPENRIIILSADSTLATKMSRHVRRIIERHPLTISLIPKKKEQWAGQTFSVERKQNDRDPSVSAFGVTGNITGARADIVIFDDVEIPKNSNTEQKREDLRERLSELEFILSPHGLQIYIGTPHTHHTIYQT